MSNKEDYIQYASTEAEKYGLDEQLFISVIQCESQWNPKAISQTGDYGIAQWNLRYNPDISKEDALNPQKAIEKMALAWYNGQENKWVCYHLITKT